MPKNKIKGIVCVYAHNLNLQIEQLQEHRVNEMKSTVFSSSSMVYASMGKRMETRGIGVHFILLFLQRVQAILDRIGGRILGGFFPSRLPATMVLASSSPCPRAATPPRTSTRDRSVFRCRRSGGTGGVGALRALSAGE